MKLRKVILSFARICGLSNKFLRRKCDNNKRLPKSLLNSFEMNSGQCEEFPLKWHNGIGGKLRNSKSCWIANLAFKTSSEGFELKFVSYPSIRLSMKLSIVFLWFKNAFLEVLSEISFKFGLMFVFL